MPYLQCPECRLTVPASAYYLRGDQCPRCLTQMEQQPTFRSRPGTMEGTWSPFIHASGRPAPDQPPRTSA
jgi:hypothetical protein